ncbi:DUF6308 family protein [Blastococcus sp. SYSU D00820]
MAYTLPSCLDDEATALGYLQEYYGPDGGDAYTGAHFDTWGGNDPDRFTAEDLVAVTFLSVAVPPMTARRLIRTEAARFADLLHAVGPDRDLVTEDVAIDKAWPARRLNKALDDLPGIGPTIASKLLARKRPHLVPIYDSVVAKVTDAYDTQWEPLRSELRRNDGALHQTLLRLREQAGIGPHVSAIRVYDVITWMEGKKKGYAPATPAEAIGAALADVPEDE